jgi:hypothetical protein
MRHPKLTQALTPLVALCCGASCLPADTRPEPAQVNCRASLAASRETFATDDGWTIAIDRLLIGLGNAHPTDDCIDYSGSRYDRLLDLSHSGDQKLSTFYALGKCAMNFRLSGPASDTVRGDGVSENDKLLLGMYGADDIVPSGAPVALDLLATATRGEVVERLHWSFRQTQRYRDCGPVADGVATPFDFQTGATLDLHIDVHPEALFRSDAQASSALHFDPIAAADLSSGNADGWVTLDELGQARLELPFSYDGVGIHDPTEIVTLEDLIYRVLVPQVPQFREPVSCPTILPESWQFD